nr:hypothetical protein [Tanacetum cinerariifolium]
MLKRLYKVGLTTRVDSFEDEPSLGKDTSKQGRISDIDANENITLVNDQDEAKMFDVNDLHGEEVFVDKDDVDKEVNDEVQKVVEEVVEDINTTKLIVDVAHVNAASELNAASIATTDNVAATITIKEISLAQALVEIKKAKPRLQAEEQQELTDEEKAILFVKLLEKRRKAFNRVNTFVDLRTEVVEDEEDIAIDDIPLVVKPLGIIDWKIYKEGKKSYYQIIKADGSSKIEFKNHSSDNEESLGEDSSKQRRINDADAEITFIDETSNDARNKNNKISNNKRWKMTKKCLDISFW